MDAGMEIKQGPQVLDVAVVGAGFSGLGMGIRLKKAGMTNFRIFEKGPDVGGTWRDNTYPGCGCDVKSQLYSYSFELFPEWSHAYATQPEIYQYIRHCADKYGMRQHLQCNATVTQATYDEANGEWEISLQSGETVRARHIVAAPGPFSSPSMPNIPGADSFKGKVVHTANWDHSLDLKGKRVGMIGTGATAIQVGPAIAPIVEHLTVFQRTPNWIIPRLDRAITKPEKWLNRHAPAFMQANRLGIYWFNELTAPFLILKYDIMKSQPEKMARYHLKSQVPDPVLRKKLLPNFRFGCKRVLVSSDWYPTLTRPNVSLVDQGIERITENGIVTADGVEHQFDVLIYATGYSVRNTGSPFPIYGRGGEALNSKWKDGCEAYNGISTHGFPNLYFLVGPFTGPGHTSVIAYAEAQINYVYQAITFTAMRGLKAVEVKPAIEARFVKLMDRLSELTVWKSGCSSWYLSPNGRNNTLYPNFNIEYQMRIWHFNPSDYQLETSSGSNVEATLGDQLLTGRLALGV